MWLKLAASGGFKLAIQARDNLERVMTAEQIAEAKRLAAEWQSVRSEK